MNRCWKVWLPCLLVLTPAPASGLEWLGLTGREPDGTPRHFLNVRAGAGTATVSRPELCVEVAPMPAIGLEACGTGSGFLHDEPDPEVGHFRANLCLASRDTPAGWLQPRLEAGFAELQVGPDEPGFTFSGTSANRNETSGPEVGASLRLLTEIGQGFELVSQAQAGAAWFPHAGQLTRPRPKVQGVVGVSMGLGF